MKKFTVSLLVVLLSIMLSESAESSAITQRQVQIQHNAVCTCNSYKVVENSGGCSELNAETPNFVFYESYSKFECNDSDACYDPATGKNIPCGMCDYGYGDTGKGDVGSGAMGTDCTKAESVEEWLQLMEVKYDFE